MPLSSKVPSLLLCALCVCAAGFAQTVDEIIERHLAAVGGREALSRLTSRTITGTVTVATPGGDITGSIEIYAKAPNKTRTNMKLDLSSFGIGEMVFDQRFDGVSGHIIDSMNGNRDIAGNQLENMRNAVFPSAFLNYKNAGIAVELAGTEKIGDQQAFVLVLRPKTGAASKQYLNASTHLVLRTVVKVDVPQLGEVEQSSEFSNYRSVDGVKVPFGLKIVNPAQTLTIRVSSVEHNKALDDSMFARPAPQ